MLLQQIEQYSTYIIISLTLLLVLSLVIQVTLWKNISRLKDKYRRLTRGINVKNLEDLILNYTDQIERMDKQLSLLEDKNNELAQKIKKCISTPKLIRYNAFDDVGSDLSFSAALLDNEKNGIILTSIYGRDESRFYVKRIDKGISNQNLSPEEEKILAEYKN
ncbi:MAG: DUF4446 family protein [Desulfotomaculum sp.]|nr:DUF4446 family protein [Desulfotomaculum sp.]